MIVADCSAVVDALTASDGSDNLRARISREELHAPALLDVEIVAALRRLTMTGQLTEARALDALTDFDDLPIVRWQTAGALRRRTFGLRDNLTAYDAAYVALAEALDCELITRDARLARSSGHAARIVVE